MTPDPPRPNNEASNSHGPPHSDFEGADPRAPIANDRTHFVVTALLFELGLGGLAVLLGWLIGYDPLRWNHSASVTTTQAAAMGFVAAFPPFAALVLLQTRTPIRLKPFVEYCDRLLVPLFSRLTIAEFGLLSIAAGIGEEVLFRGLLQGAFDQWVGDSDGALLGLVLSSIIFGGCHYLNKTYAVLATVAGFYLGILYLISDHLLVPIVAHVLYDFGALVYVTKKRRPELIRPPH